MAKQNVGITGLNVAVFRAIEQYQPEQTRICNDTLAIELVSATYRFLLQFATIRNLALAKSNAVSPMIYGAQICRTRYLDDVVTDCLSRGIFKQLVILGAGLDSRPYRLPGMEKIKVFEVDLPSVQEYKKKKIKSIFGSLPENVTFLPIDFENQDLETVFLSSDFDPSSLTIFIWEGVTQYLTVDGVRQTFSFIGKSKPGSIILFTYVLRSIIERRLPEANKLLDFSISQGYPFIFGLEPSEISSFLKPFHLKPIEEVGMIEFQKRYLDPISRQLVLSDAERIVQAIVN